MTARPFYALSIGLIGVLACCVLGMGGEPAAKPKDTPPAKQEPAARAAEAESGEEAGEGSEKGAAKSAKPAAKPGRPSAAELLKDMKPIEGLIKLYRKDDKLLAELGPAQLDRDIIVVISIARGIGEGMVLGGMSWGVGDDWIWQFRKVDDKIQVVRRNVRFTAAKGSPEEHAVRVAYTDSILYSLPILATASSGGHLVDFSTVFLSDLPQIGAALPGFSFARDRSTWAATKGFKDNVELEVAATYASGGRAQLDTVPDSRGLTVNVHYSISLLPQHGYQPRAADDRVGYFTSVIKDFSKKSGDDRFVRYVTRWDVRKADPAAALSPPKQPLVIWIEKTVPYEHRKPVREGILEWNKAFERIGLANVIEVRQQPEDAQWDPEDVNYNTFRWITSGKGFAMGPSRVNPLTGEILDTDIIFDADFLQAWKDEYEFFVAKKEGGAAGATGADAPARPLPRQHACCALAEGMRAQLALGAAAIKAGRAADKEEFQKLVQQALKAVVVHEVGHALGLRHNFKASAYLSLEEINHPKRAGVEPLSASVMDYLPVNVSPKGRPQGDYFTPTIGPYDYWAIEYGYKPLSGGSDGEAAELAKIAARTNEPALAYASDEDCGYFDPDPLVNQFDLGKDPVEFARWRDELVRELLPGLVDRVVEPGAGYDRARRALNVLLHQEMMAMAFAGRLVGGVYVSRGHKGDPNGRPPLVVVEPARQREALAVLDAKLLGPEGLTLPTDLLAYLAESKWTHWGMHLVDRPDFPVRDRILMVQDIVLGRLLSGTTLSRLLDNEIRVPGKEDAFTAAELFAALTKAIFSETAQLDKGKFTPRKPAIPALRRALQRRYVERLAELALGTAPGPEDAQTLAYAELGQIRARIGKVLGGKVKLDAYSRAHLEETSARIGKVLDARVELRLR